MSKLTLKLDEANDLNFEFKVQGSSSEPGAGTPQFRFVVFEKAAPNKMGFVFPVTSKESNGTITVSIPAMKGIFKDKEPYVGKVEVIIGTRLLVPTTLELEFIETLSVQINPIAPPDTSKVDGRSIEELLPDLIDEPVVPVKSPELPKEGRKITLTKTQLQALLTERRAKQSILPQDSKIKDSLKNLLKGALEED